MRVMIVGIAAAVAMILPAHAQEYRRYNILTGGAYTDRAVGKDVWKIMGTSDTAKRGQAHALYRSAQIIAKAGAPAFRIVKQRVRTTTTEYRYSRTMELRESANLTIRAVRTPDLTACEMPVTTQCLTIKVEDVMARFGPELGLPTRPLAALGELPFEVTYVNFRWVKPVTARRVVVAPVVPAPHPVVTGSFPGGDKPIQRS